MMTGKPGIGTNETRGGAAAMRLSDEKRGEVVRAMELLGHPNPDNAEVRLLDGGRARVDSGGRYFGIYDFTRHTFVD